MINLSHGQLGASQIIIEKDCHGDIISGSFILYSDSYVKTEVFNLSSSICDIEFFMEGKQLQPEDILILSDFGSIEIDFEFENDKSVIKEIYFSTLTKKENVIPIHMGSFQVLNEEIKEGLNKIINVSGICSDSIKIFFPYGGTISSVSLHKDKDDLNYSNSISYGVFGPNNFLTFSKADLGKHYLRFMACHWGNNFWLELKE